MIWPIVVGAIVAGAAAAAAYFSRSDEKPASGDATAKSEYGPGRSPSNASSTTQAVDARRFGPMSYTLMYRNTLP